MTRTMRTRMVRIAAREVDGVEEGAQGTPGTMSMTEMVRTVARAVDDIEAGVWEIL